MSKQNEFAVSNYRVDYVALADEKGATLGRYLRTLKTLHGRDSLTIERAAIAFVNSLPMDDIEFEIEIRDAFEYSAHKTLESK